MEGRDRPAQDASTPAGLIFKEEKTMLVLSRQQGERIIIGDDVTVQVVRISSGSVRLAITAPMSKKIIREELETHPIQASESDISDIGRLDRH